MFNFLVFILSLLVLSRGFRLKFFSSRLSRRFVSVETDPVTINTDPFVGDIELYVEDVLKFLSDGHVFIPGCMNKNMILDELKPEMIGVYNSFRTDEVKGLVNIDIDNMTKPELETLTTKFLELENDANNIREFQHVWNVSPAARSIASSPCLGKIACQLLNKPTVRLYDDKICVISPDTGYSTWATDLSKSPFDSNDMVTFCIPFFGTEDNEENGGALAFATGSQRDYALPYWSDPTAEELTERYDIVSYHESTVGDISAHHGWCSYCSLPNKTPYHRMTYLVSFIASGQRLLHESKHTRYPDTQHFQHHEEWIEEVGWGGIADHPALPVVYCISEDPNYDGNVRSADEIGEEEDISSSQTRAMVDVDEKHMIADKTSTLENTDAETSSKTE